MDDFVGCNYCGNKLPAPKPNEGVDCICGQKMFNSPSKYGGEMWTGGCYKVCGGCGKLIKSSVSYSQHFHDECAPETIKNLTGVSSMARTNLPVEEKHKFRCRNDNVLLRIINIGSVGSVLIPEISAAGKEFRVVAMGPKVEGLKLNDRVLPSGSKGALYYELPFDKNLIIVRECDISIVFDDPKNDE